MAKTQGGSEREKKSPNRKWTDQSFQSRRILQRTSQKDEDAKFAGEDQRLSTIQPKTKDGAQFNWDWDTKDLINSSDDEGENG